MSVHVDVDIRHPLPSGVDEPLVRQVLEAAARQEGVRGEVSVSFVSDEEIHELNRQYRGVDRPTDVLSFALQEGEPMPGGDDDLPLLGDVVVSVPTAVRQAEAYGHSVRREVAFLLVHGFLHLLGYDHPDEASEQDMMQRQERVLTGLGLTREAE
ncbi:rRNA maturation RNase YbeY [Alicyclobacillus macrosporangiidus]|jgi:probable rRNA maturation factor|uniref:Endoribonuclease YbeY n=1 Tax=Alicyclobacillus macrosporangiidus TaxID=392015 RepID=A0A1I7K7X6_9BACL|nr:rRNA maturation RNase YbeY [Alicyclobacillus macrosporangiidus]SFU93563.1 probable rRNA maturation factor [Alicyclobacillus macrosporangiidus]